MLRVWFNHWFSQVYRLIELINENEDGQKFYIIGSNDKMEAVYQNVCDEWYQEPIFETGAEYVDWCLDFCTIHKIDLFIPRRHMKAISFNISRFEAIGVRVLVHKDNAMLDILNNKYCTAELFKAFDICKVPPIEVVYNVEEFESAYARMKDLIGDNRVCIKYSEGEGATSFRVIDEKAESIESLKRGTGAKMTYEQVVAMLGTVESFDELMIMPYLNGVEISIDSVMTSAGFIGIPRYKYGSRATKIDINEEIIEISKRFAEVTGITCPYNLQLRYHEDELYLLEVNTRMAGGTYLSKYAGVNLPYIAIKELLGQPIELPKELNNALVTQIETPVLLIN